MQANRRVFLFSSALLGQTALTSRVFAAPPRLDPADPQATTLGYTPDSDKVPAAFAQKHAPGARCGNCALFQGKAADTPGPCPLFGGKTVQANGWCSSWVAKG